MNKIKSLHIRMNEEDFDFLKYLCEQYNCSQTNLVTKLIRRGEYIQLNFHKILEFNKVFGNIGNNINQIARLLTPENNNTLFTMEQYKEIQKIFESLKMEYVKHQVGSDKMIRKIYRIKIQKYNYSLDRLFQYMNSQTIPDKKVNNIMYKVKELHIRMNDEDFNYMKLLCEQYNCSQTVLITELIKSGSYIQLIYPKIQELNQVLGNIGNSINQIAKILNTANKNAFFTMEQYQEVKRIFESLKLEYAKYQLGSDKMIKKIYKIEIQKYSYSLDNFYQYVEDHLDFEEENDL